jgi:hypothetical protein
LKRSILPLIVALFLLFGNGARADAPLTDAEARAYVRGAGEDRLVADVLKLDRIERAVPVIEIPRWVGILTVDGELVLWSLGLTDMINWTIRIADLDYSVSMDPIRIPDFHKDTPTPWRWILVPAAGAAAGVIGCLVGGGTQAGQLGAAAGIGAGLGLVVAAIWPP